MIMVMMMVVLVAIMMMLVMMVVLVAIMMMRVQTSPLGSVPKT